MKRFLLILAAILRLETAAHSTQWTDPGFEEMVAGAELIAVVEVVEGGKFICIAKALEVLKGADPGGNFIMGDFNNPNWPTEGVKKESMAKGDRLLVFLHEQPLRDEKGELKETKEAKEGKKTWAAPTPSTGDFRIIDGKLHGGWYLISYPHSQPGIDASAAITLIRGYLLHLAGKPPAEAWKLLREKLTADLSKGVNEEDEGEENNGKAKLLEWLLCAQGAYGEKELTPAILAAAKAKHDLLKICAARALRSAGNSEQALSGLDQLLHEENSFAQSEAAKTMMLNGFPREKAIPLLLKALPKSSVADGGPSRIMDPLLNTSASGRESIIRAITRLSAEKEAQDELLKLIQGEGLVQGVFIALAEHFLKFPSEKARAKFIELYGRSPESALSLFHGYLLREKSPEAIKAVAEKLMVGGWNHSLTVETLHGMLGLKAISARDPLLIKLVLFAQKKFKEPEESRMLLELSIPAASAEIENYLENYSQKDLDEHGLEHLKIVKESVQLVLHPGEDRKKTIDQWVDLIRREEEVWGLPRLMLGELVRATPSELRDYSVRKLRQAHPKSCRNEVLDAIKALGGKLTVDEENTLSRRRVYFEITGP